MKAEWITVRLGDLASKESRSVISGPFGSDIGTQYFRPDGVPVIRGNNLTTDFMMFLDDGFVFVTDEKAEELDAYAIRNDILLTAAGTIGQVGMIPSSSKFSRYVISNKQLRIRIDSTKANPLYVYYWLASPWIFKAITDRNTGSTVPLINLGTLRGLPVKMPVSRFHQDSIAELIGALDAKIELNQRMNEELEGMAKLLYDYWFVQYDFPMSAAQPAALGKPHLTGHPYRASGGPMTYHETLKREIPNGWEVGSLNCLGEIMGGSTPSTKEEMNFTTQGTPWITPKDMSRNTGNKFISRGETDVSAAGIKNASLTLLPAGTVLMSSRAPIGYIAIARNPVTTNQGFKSFVPSKGYSTEFIYYTLSHQMKVIEQNASGSTFKEVSAATLKGIQTILPEASVRAEFAKVLKPILAQQDTLEQQTQELTTLRDWLLPMLMNGQVTVGGLGQKKTAVDCSTAAGEVACS